MGPCSWARFLEFFEFEVIHVETYFRKSIYQRGDQPANDSFHLLFRRAVDGPGSPRNPNLSRVTQPYRLLEVKTPNRPEAMIRLEVLQEHLVDLLLVSSLRELSRVNDADVANPHELHML